MELRSNAGRTLLSLAFIIQLVVLVQSTIRPVLIDILSSRNSPATERSAAIAFGDDFAGYVRFVREWTKETDVVLIPSPEAHEVLSHVGIMQYYLIPRSVSNCPMNQSFEECFLVQGGPKTSILSVNGTPPIILDEGDYRYESFNDSWGIYIPINHDEID